MINGIKNWFWRSETIAWARLQMFVGIVWTVLSASDLSPVLDPKWLTYWLIASGVISEYLRRRGSTGETIQVAEPTATGVVQPVTKSFLSDKPPGP